MPPRPDCDCCGRPAVGVATSTLGPIRLSLCRDCSVRGAEPAVILGGMMHGLPEDNMAPQVWRTPVWLKDRYVEVGELRGRKDPNCERCKLETDHQTYTAQLADGEYTWNVGVAFERLLAGCPQAELAPMPDDIVEWYVTHNCIEPAHVAHVNPLVPGMCVALVSDGQVQHYPIDGLHRAKRCQELGLRYYAWMLPEDVSDYALMASPHAGFRPVRVTRNQMGDFLRNLMGGD